MKSCVFRCVALAAHFFIFRDVSDTEKSVCFIGHRKIKETPKLERKIEDTVYELLQMGKDNFILGDHSEFNSLCYGVLHDLKKELSFIRIIHFRCDYEDTDDYTMSFLIVGYDETICPKGVGSAGRAAYVERNKKMIDESEICVFYYDENYKPGKRNSGTKIAYEYAKKKNKKIINLF